MWLVRIFHLQTTNQPKGPASCTLLVLVFAPARWAQCLNTHIAVDVVLCGVILHIAGTHKPPATRITAKPNQKATPPMHIAAAMLQFKNNYMKHGTWHTTAH